MNAIREARFEDYSAIAALERRHGLFNTPEADWLKRWQGNPVLNGHPTSWPIGWVIEREEDEGDRIGGFFGNIPMAYELDQKTILVAATNSWVVDDDCRNQALALLSRFLAQPSVNVYLSTTANAATLKAMIAFKSKKVPQPGCDEALYWITHSQNFAEALAVKTGIPMAKIFGWLAGTVISVLNMVRRLPVASAPSELKLSAIGRFDDRFDELWQAVRSGSGKLRLVRDRDTLNWHFERFLRDDQAWIVTCERENRLVGYAVFVRQDNKTIGLRRAVLADMQSLNDDAEVLRQLFLAGHSECRNRKIGVLEAVGQAQSKRHLLQQLRPRKRKFPTWPYLYKARGKQLATALSGPDGWDLGPIDGDASL